MQGLSASGSSQSVDNAAHLGLSDPELSGQVALLPLPRGIKRFKVPHLFVRDFMRRVTFSEQPRRSPLGVAVSNILCVCSGKQVQWVAAKRGIASMTDAQGICDWSVRYLKSIPVRLYLLSFTVWKPNPKSSITLSGFPLFPKPAPVWLNGKAFNEVHKLHAGYLTLDMSGNQPI